MAGVGTGPRAGALAVLFWDFLRGFPFVGFVFLSTGFAFLGFGEVVELLKNGEVVGAEEEGEEGGGMS